MEKLFWLLFKTTPHGASVLQAIVLSVIAVVMAVVVIREIMSFHMQ